MHAIPGLIGKEKIPILRNCVKDLKAGSVVLELGTYHGFSSSILAQANKDIIIHTVDRQNLYEGNDSNVIFHHREFLEFCVDQNDNAYDFIFWDGQHKSVKKQTKLITEIRRILKPNCICLVDDINDPNYTHIDSIELSLMRYNDMIYDDSLYELELGIIRFE